MAQLRGVDAVVGCLRRLGIERVYGVIGTSIVGLLDGLYEARDAIRYISCRHEQVAASMADAEGRLTRRPGVVALHSGPGALNAMISLANAAKDCSPVIALSGATKRRLRGCDGMLELDHVRLFRPLCRAALRIEATHEILAVMSQAYRAAMAEPGGPVLVEVPEDLWTARDEFDFEALETRLPAPTAAAEESVGEVAARLLQSARAVILAGAGITYARAADRLLRLAERLQVPVVTTGNGRGALSEAHPLCLGRTGYGGGNLVADEALRRADFILAVGCTLSDMTTYEYTWPIQADIIAVNLDRDNEQKKIPIEAVYADAAVFLDQLLVQLERLEPRPRAIWTDQLAEARQTWANLLTSSLRPIESFGSPALVCATLDRMLPEDAIVTVGAGMHLLYPAAFLRARRPGCYLSAVNFGSMGFGFPAALGAQAVCPGRTIVTILGDGDFLMTVQDLETAVRESLPVKIFVINDNSYRVLAFRQRLQYHGHVYGSTHGNPDLVKLAESFGIQAWRLDAAEQTERVVAKALQAKGPVLVEVVTSPDDIPPTNLQAALGMSE